MEEVEWEKIDDESLLLAAAYNHFSEYLENLPKNERRSFNKLTITANSGHTSRLVYELEQSTKRLGCMSVTARTLAQFVYEVSPEKTVFLNQNIEQLAQLAKWKKSSHTELVMGVTTPSITSDVVKDSKEGIQPRRLSK